MILIALLTGIFVTLVTYVVFDALKDWEVQKKLKGKAGNLYFLASKIGELLKNRRISFLDDSATTVKTSFVILGEPYNRMEPYAFFGIQTLCALGAVVVTIVVVGTYDLLTLIAAAGAGIFLPYAYVRQKVKDKHRALFRQIPDVLDLMRLMIEAGLEFNASLDKLLASESGALVNELFLAQQEVKLGRPRTEAYAAMAERLKYPPLNTVINSINSALRTGARITPALKTLSGQFRTERSQLAEKLAAEAPLKLMAPLVLLIFPTIFIILFGPILLSFLGK